jgi:hypothetical protein
VINRKEIHKANVVDYSVSIITKPLIETLSNFNGTLIETLANNLKHLQSLRLGYGTFDLMLKTEDGEYITILFRYDFKNKYSSQENNQTTLEYRHFLVVFSIDKETFESERFSFRKSNDM